MVAIIGSVWLPKAEYCYMPVTGTCWEFMGKETIIKEI